MRHWPSPGCLPPAPHSQWVPGGASGGAHKERILDFLPPPTPLPFCPLSFPVQRRPSYLLAGEVGKEGGGPVSRCRSRPVPFLGRSPVHCARTEEKGGRRPKPAGLYAPRSQAVILPLTLPPPICTPGHTQESHQLPPLSRGGPAAPRASRDVSLAAVSSSSSSSSSSPSMNSSWLRP